MIVEHILFWNIRSVQTQNSFERVLDSKRRYHYSFIALLEPFQRPQKLELYKRKLGMEHAVGNFSNKIWVFWNEDWKEEE